MIVFDRLAFLADIQNSNVDKKSVDSELSVRLANYVDVYYRDVLTDDLDYMVATASEADIQKCKLHGGEVIITKDSESRDDIGIAAYVDDDIHNLVCGYHLTILRPKARTDGKFLFYCFNSRNLKTQLAVSANGVTRYGLSQSAIKNLVLPAPPLPTQRAIARYLDAHTARIDALIARKQRLLELLAERRAALITRAVTRGLDPAAPTYDSGVDWLGEIPVGWEVKRLKHLVDLRSGSTITSSEIRDTGIFKVYGGNGLRGYYDNYTHEGDHVLVGRQGHLCGNINYATGQFWASEHAVVCNPLTSYPTFWLGELLRTMNLNQYSISAAQPGLAVERIKELVVPVPPLDQAREIASLVKTKISRFETTELTINTSIYHLQEYRSALITAAVNGEVQLPQPE